MASITLHNTLTGKKELFKPLKPGELSLYVCGITPYDTVHLGHARCYVVFDLLKRVFQKNDYKVRHIQNFTDVDDKIIERANKEKVKPDALAKRNIEDYYKWMDQLNVSRADQYPCVTGQMPVIQKLISRLIDQDMAYQVDGDVFFAVRKFKPYGDLSKRKIDELEVGARVDVDERKKDPLDFALWKKAKEGEPFWDSPWGKGRPGWHIECSAMSMEFLGETFDIHGGGQDLIFPHHENEVAQSNGATGNPKGFAQTWVHNGFVTINKQKMSKSLGNFFTIKDILAKFDPMSVRYFLLTQHYRSPLNFSDKDLTVAQNTWRQRIVGAAEKIQSFINISPSGGGSGSNKLSGYREYVEGFHEALRKDLNTPAALGELNKFCNAVIFQVTEDKAKLLGKPYWEKVSQEFQEMLDTLGLKIVVEENWSKEILDLLDERQRVRKEKNWARADEIRDLLKAKGVTVKDTPQGPKPQRL